MVATGCARSDDRVPASSPSPPVPAPRRQHPPPPAGAEGRARRIAFTAVLATAMAIGPYAVYALGALAPLLDDDLGLTRAELGVLSTVTVAFGCLGAPILGGLVDRVGGRRLAVLLFSGAALGLGASAAAPSYAALLVAVSVCGVALSLIDPVTNWLVSTHIPRERQGLTVGVKQSGVQFGALFAGGVLPSIGLWLGWRGALAVSAAVPVLALAVGWLVIPRDPPRPPPAGPGARRIRVGPSVRWMAAYAGCMGGGVAPVSTYLPLFAHERVGVSIPVAGIVAAAIAAAGVVARILWGRHAGRVRSTPAVLCVLAVLSVVSSLLLWSGEVAGLGVLWVGALVFGASAGAWHAVAMVSLVRDGDVRVAGRAAGLVQMCFYLGFLITPPLFGYTVDATGRYDLGWVLVIAMFAAGTAVAVAWRRRVPPDATAAAARHPLRTAPATG